jgi:hypothetical protein
MQVRIGRPKLQREAQSTQHFSNGIGSPTTSWTNLGSPGTITDGAWITYSDDFGVTAYFRQGTEIMQTALPLGTTPVMAVRPDTGIVFDSAPAATGGLAFDQGTNIVVARSATTNQLYYIESNAITWLGL